MGVFKNRGTPKWMVKIMENPINPWMIWGDFTHYFRKHPYSFCRKKSKICPSSQGLWRYAPAHWRYPRSQSPQVCQTKPARDASVRYPLRCSPRNPETSIQKKWVADSIGRWFPKFFTLGNDWKFTRSPFRLKTTGSVGVPEVKERWFRWLFLHFLVRWRVHGFLTPCVKKGMYNIPGNFAPWGGWSFRCLPAITRNYTNPLMWSFWILCTCKTLPVHNISKIFGKIKCHDICHGKWLNLYLQML